MFFWGGAILFLDDDMYLLTLLTIYMIQINQNIYKNYRES